MNFITSGNTWTGYRWMGTCFCAVLLCCVNACSAQIMKHDSSNHSVTETSRTKGRLHLFIHGSNSVAELESRIPILQNNTAQNPSDESSRPARVSFLDGSLLVEANNSSLSDILQNVSDICGISMNRIENSPRIFGVYGPGKSRDVLVDLLYGSGYNFIMVGGAIQGTPRALILVARKSSAPVPVAAHSTSVELTKSDAPGQSELEKSKIVPDSLGPGAVTPVPSLDMEDDSTRAQANQQRLQHIQDQQQNTPQ